MNELKSTPITTATDGNEGGGGDTIVTGTPAKQLSNQAIFIQLNQKHLLQNNLNMANNTDDTDSMHSDSNTNTNSNTMTTTSKSYKSEDIPLTISTSLAKQSSLPRTRSAYRHRERSYCDSTDSNESNDESDYKSGSNHSHKQHTYSQHTQYSTINTSVGASGCSAAGMDYLRKSTPHLHRNMNNNNTIASTPNHRYRWTNNHSKSAIVASHPQRNNNNFNKKSNHFAIGEANSVLDTMTMQPNHHHHHHHHRSIPSKFHRQNLQFNNNFIVTNQKQLNAINGLGAPNNEQNDGSIGGGRIGNDQHNGNHLSTMHSRSNGSSRLHH